MPYDQKACVSGLRVFGKGNGQAPKTPTFTAKREDDRRYMKVTIESPSDDVAGYNILWGHKADKLYHSYMVFGVTETEIKALVTTQDYFVRVDAFNENGITEGQVIALA